MIGRHLGHFYVIRNLGGGGMGVVYEAQDTRLPRSVALKFLKPALAKDLAAVRRFRREARLASTLNHPNICTVLDVLEGDGSPFIAMELLHGTTVRERLARSPMTPRELMLVALQAVDALAAAHEQSILHRDITPGNIFLTDDGVAKLLDFGLAKSFAAGDDGDVQSDLTQPGALVGTIHYMAPELFDVDLVPDARSDLYAFGAVIYQMATGTRPFEGRSRDDVIHLVRNQPHIPLRRLAPNYPPLLEQIIDRLLAKRPEDRYPSAAALKVDLDTLARQTHQPRSMLLAPTRIRRQGVVVLPFRDIGRPSEEGVPTGHEFARSITAELGRHAHVHVVDHELAAQASSLSMRDIGVQLHVATIVEGSLQHAASRVRVTANIVDTTSERPRGPAMRADREAAHLVGGDEDVASHFAGRIAAYVQQFSGGATTRDADANAAFKRGLHHWQSRFSGGWRAAIEQFEYAIQRDARFARAHVALAAVYEFLGFYSYMKPALAFAIARESIERALEIDDSLGEAQTELALIRFGGDWDWEGSEQAFRRALQLDPTNAVTHVCYSWLLILLGRDDAAFAEAQSGYNLSTGSRFVISGRAQTLYLARRFQEAIDLSNECLRLDPDYVFAVALRGQCYELTSRWEEAIADLEHAAKLTQRAPFYIGVLGHCYGRVGRRAEALALVQELDRLRHDMYVPPQCYVYIYAGLGDRPRALEYQDKAYDDGASPFNYFAPSIRDLYALDPRHKQRLQQMRLVI